MRKGKTSARLETLNRQRKKLNARIHKMEALEKQKQRKMDLRRKILVGSYYLEEALKNGTMEDLKQRMLVFLKRETDRALFNTEA